MAVSWLTDTGIRTRYVLGLAGSVPGNSVTVAVWAEVPLVPGPTVNRPVHSGASPALRAVMIMVAIPSSLVALDTIIPIARTSRIPGPGASGPTREAVRDAGAEPWGRSARARTDGRARTGAGMVTIMPARTMSEASAS